MYVNFIVLFDPGLDGLFLNNLLRFYLGFGGVNVFCVFKEARLVHRGHSDIVGHDCTLVLETR